MRHADRHGRARRADGDRRRRPVDGFRAGDAGRFRHLVEEALALLPVRLARELAGAQFVLRDVPPDESPAGDGVWEPPLASLELGPPRRLTVHRRAIELRAGSRGELIELIREAAAEAIGRALGLPEEEWRADDGG